jgi:hypothetical protein
MQCCSSWPQRSWGAFLPTPESTYALSGRDSGVLQRDTGFQASLGGLEVPTWSSVAQGVNVLGCKTKVRKLFIIKLSKPRPYALLPGIVVSLNKSTHQARLGFQMRGRACGHASPQKLKVHDRLLFFPR